jgi:hypothetical protein
VSFNVNVPTIANTWVLSLWSAWVYALQSKASSTWISLTVWPAIPPLALRYATYASRPSLASWNNPGTGPDVVVIWPIVMVLAVTPGPLIAPVTVGGGGIVDPVPAEPEVVVAEVDTPELEVLLLELLHAASARAGTADSTRRRAVQRRFRFTSRSLSFIGCVRTSAGIGRGARPPARTQSP